MRSDVVIEFRAMTKKENPIRNLLRRDFSLRAEGQNLGLCPGELKGVPGKWAPTARRRGFDQGKGAPRSRGKGVPVEQGKGPGKWVPAPARLRPERSKLK